ncbi:DUF805 domain-containing protein [Rhodovibrionaceae bacterium A322]
MDLVVSALTKKYFDFSGRARRKEYWLFQLSYIILGLIGTVLDVGLGLFDPETGFGMFSAILGIALFIPSLSVSIRRLHDIGKSGWFILLIFIPVIGAIVLLVFFCLKSEDGENRFGPNPIAHQGTRDTAGPDANNI